MLTKVERARHVSDVPTPHAVTCQGVDIEVGIQKCNNGELIFLTPEGYNYQMDRPDDTWKCPICGGPAVWSEENYETRTA